MIKRKISLKIRKNIVAIINQVPNFSFLNRKLNSNTFEDSNPLILSKFYYFRGSIILYRL